MSQHLHVCAPRCPARGCGVGGVRSAEQGRGAREARRETAGEREAKQEEQPAAGRALAAPHAALPPPNRFKKNPPIARPRTPQRRPPPPGPGELREAERARGVGAGDTLGGGGSGPLCPPPEQRGPAAPGVAIREARAAAGPWPWGSAPLAGKARRKSPGGAEWAEGGVPPS